MTGDSRINIGGVSYNKADVKKAEVIKQQNGETVTSVWLKDGTHVVYPQQDESREPFVKYAKDGDDVEIGFHRMQNAQITGTKGKNDYTLSGCMDSSVDVSHNDKVKDVVTIENDNNREDTFYGYKIFKKPEEFHSTENTFLSAGNSVVQNEKDVTYVEDKNRIVFDFKHDAYRGIGRVEE